MSFNKVRGLIYNCFQGSKFRSTTNCGFLTNDKCTQYEYAMYLLQDSYEGCLAHRQKGFSNSPSLAYIELWGVLQAVIIQQDSIEKLYQAITNTQMPQQYKMNAWDDIRRLRNKLGGHPIASQHGKKRSFLGRSFGGYSALSYEEYDVATNQTSHPTINFGNLIDAYQRIATIILYLIYRQMRQKW